MILQGVFQDDRNKPIVSAEHIAELERRHAEGLDAALPKPEPGFFDGVTEAWKGLPAGALKSASLAKEITANSGWVNVDRERLEQEGGYVENSEKYQKQLSERMESEAKEYRELANGKFGIDSETVGMAGQVLYGLTETLPKALLATAVAGPYGGAAAFGLDYGGNEYLKLRDEGVDKTTAGISAAVSGVSGGIGVLLPATFGQSRVASATIGALANMGLTGAELGTVGYVLQSQGYEQLSERYGLNATSIITSGVFGAAFGAGMWRPRGRATESQTQQYFDETQRKSVEDNLFDQLKAVGGKYEDETVARTQARLHAVGIENLAKTYGLSHEDTMNIVPSVVKDDGSLDVGSLRQIIGERGVGNLDQAEENWTRTNNLMTAKQMFFDGKDAKTVRLATGWERGADGKWRYEIPDIQLKEDAFRVIDEAKQAQDAEEDLLWQRNDLSDDEFIAGVQSIAKKYEDTTLVTKLEDVVEAPELFAAYPQLKGLTVEFGHLPKGTGGYYASGSNTIRLSRDANILKNSTRSTLAHEIQHAIQEIEGFAKGASPEIMMSKDAALWRDMARMRELRRSDVWKQYKKLSDEYFASGVDDPLTLAEIDRLGKSSDVIEVNKEIDRLHKKWGNKDLIRGAIENDNWEPGDPFAKQIAEDDPFFAIQQYMKVAGEVEGRNVQKRLYMSAAERLSTTLESTEDRPRSEQIVSLMNTLYRQMMYPPIEVEPKFELITVSKDSNGVEHKVWGVNGNPDLTVLPDNVEGIKPLPLRLQESTLKSGHIDKHLPDLKKAGYESIEQAIWDISQNYTAIYKGKKEGQLILSRPILVESDGRLRKGILYTEFQEVSGSYRVGSVVASANPRYLENKQPLWEKSHTNRLVLANRTRGLTGPEQLSTEISIAQTESSVNAFVPDSNLIESAKENFGVTKDVREAFYVLPDGTMLDGSGRHWGGDERDVAGTRQVDHADIAEVLDSSGAKAMYEFMGKTGAMRFDANARIASIARKPTERQLAVLNRTFRGDYSALSFNTPEGRIVDDIEFESTSPSKVRSFFDQAQVKADNGVAGAFAQRAWHGSPHIFDEFSTEHIGSGEGAQAHGWGLYFAKDRDLARSYRERLAKGDWADEWSVNNRSYEEAVEGWQTEDGNVMSDFLSHLRLSRNKKEATNKQLDQAYQATVKAASNDEFSSKKAKKAYLGKLLKFQESLHDLKITRTNLGGRLFEVDIPDEKYLLDEQRQLSEMSPDVRNAVHQLISDMNGGRLFDDLVGESIDDFANDYFDGSKANLFRKQAREFLLKRLKGVPEDEAAKVFSMSVDGEILSGLEINSGVDRLRMRFKFGDIDSYTGLRIRTLLVGLLNSEKKASLLLNEYGVKGISYDGGMDGRCFVVFDDKAINVLDYYQKAEASELVRGSYSPGLNQITLTPNANLSTFSHEMGHWYLDTMFKLSGKGNEPLNKDVEILLREFGVKSLDDWNALGLEGQRKYHEQFASWLEVYLSKGEAPNPTLKEVLARVAQWIVDVYESFGGTKKAVGERFESEFGTQLPEMSDEVKAVMDRLFAEHKANQKASKAKPTSEQTSAARVVLASTAQTSRLQKLMSKDPKKLTAKDARDLQAMLRGGDVAAQQLSQGQSVDVAKNFSDAEVDTNVVKETRGNFAREYLMGGDDAHAVVLQNRDRDTVASVAQMNRIAAKPDYYLASTSRSLQDGAPIVSFGSLPDNEHLGIGDVVVASGGRRVPIQYAVVEADSILTSNDYLGNANASYGDPSQINAVAGNGRVTGIREGYNRGTAEQYKADMIADQSHGIKPEVIEKMEKPILVRFVSKEDVTSKLIDDSNRQSTLARSPVEQAVDDAKLISKNVDQYRFDDDGLPTETTVRQFVNDIGDPNVLGRLLTPNGSITPEAVTRVQNAVVQAAYGDLNFTQLFAMETRHGAKRLMNALVAVAPKFVEIRNALGDSYDFSTQLLEGFKQVRESILAGQDSVIQSGSIFGDNGVSPFVDLLDRNRNSMAGVMRELTPIFDAIDQVRAQGGGFFEEAPMDFADILANVRRVQNEALLNEGKPLLMDIDPDEIRQGMALARQAFEEMKAEETVAPVEGESADTMQAMEEQPINPVEKSRALLTEDADAIRIDELQEELGDMTFSVEGENGQMIDLSIDEIKALNEADLATADTESASLGEAFACVDLNRGI